MVTPALQQNRMALHDLSQSSQVTEDSQLTQPRPSDSGISVSEARQESSNSQAPPSTSNSQARQGSSNSQARPSPSNSQSRPSQPRRVRSKPALQRYEETQPLSCGDANGSRSVSSRRHIVENINASIKRYKFFSNTVNRDHIKSGYAYASIKLVCGITNYRFKNGATCIDYGWKFTT